MFRSSQSAPRALLTLGLASVAMSLAIRVLYRGGEMPGWDYLLTVEGRYLLATKGPVGALHETLVQVRRFWLPPAAYSVPYGLIPGALALWWPGLYWQPVVVFLAWLVTLALLLAASGWSLRSGCGWGCALLAWGASPALLSYSVEGYPWGGGTLPHALALALMLARPHLSWGLMLPGLALTWELPWHGYEIGKTAGVTLLLSALLAPNAGMARRLACIATAAFQLYATWLIWPSSNIVVLSHGNVGAGVGILNAWSLLSEGVRAVMSALCGTRPMLVPALILAGALALPWAGKRRLPLAAVWCAQLALVVLLAASGGADLLRARRFHVVEGLSIAAVLAAVRAGPVTVRTMLLTLLIAGNAWALAGAAHFAMAPRVAVGFSLPGVDSPEGVGMVDRPAIAWAETLAARAERGERVVLLHSQDCSAESYTNPIAVLERLYLRLGHQTFRARVVAVGVPTPRYVTVPVVDVREVIDTLLPGQVIDMDATCLPMMTEPLAALRARFLLTPLTDEQNRFTTFRLDPYPAVGVSGGLAPDSSVNGPTSRSVSSLSDLKSEARAKGWCVPASPGPSRAPRSTGTAGARESRSPVSETGPRCCACPREEPRSAGRIASIRLRSCRGRPAREDPGADHSGEIGAGRAA